MSVKTQRHIHLAPTLGPAPENSPPVKWRVKSDDRSLQEEVIVAANRSLTGALVHGFLGNGIKPRRYRNAEYTVVVGPEYGFTALERLEELLSYNGRLCYWTDNTHPDDGEDHASYTRQVLVSIREFKTIDPMDSRYEVPIRLMDVAGVQPV